MKRYFFLALLHCCVVAAMAQTQLSNYQPGVTPEGAVYFLPKTAIKFHILVEKSTFQPGDFASYAHRYLRLVDVGQEPSVSCRLLGVRQEAVAIADSTKAYAVKFNAKTVAANVALSQDGCLLAINAAPAKTANDFEPFEAAPRQEPVNARTLLNEEILAAGSTAKMAELTAREIYDLRENRNLLIKGQADFMPKDGAQLRLMLNQLEQQDRALSSLFVGTTRKDTTEYVVTATPDGPFTHQLLFRLSDVNGVVDTDDLSGAPFYLTVEDMNTVPPVDEEAAAKNKKKPFEAGIYVNVPGRMRVTLFEGITPIQTEEHPAPQFGNVELLSGELFNKRYTTHLWLNPLTGAVERLEAEQPK
ncbi:DUF4831 family protein [Prevotella sp. E13-17]|uniref:DUF4831 family protein n=1 Tax=Prevotella sp. E13-17 TaxID=2913616 RepID=UPI001EDC0271|nr:DUF4831 family protein [Prevotella sp. E13-17]UKK50688.1 DUF4831 family protein [Prevotella sp. E13-17]